MRVTCERCGNLFNPNGRKPSDLVPFNAEARRLALCEMCSFPTIKERVMQNPVNPSNHPNATIALISSLGLGSAVVAVFQHWFGVKLSTQDGIYIAGGLATVVLWIGRHGIMGIKNVILHGTKGPK